jgi:hypothetical protein
MMPRSASSELAQWPVVVYSICESLSIFEAEIFVQRWSAEVGIDNADRTSSMFCQHFSGMRAHPTAPIARIHTAEGDCPGRLPGARKDKHTLNQFHNFVFNQQMATSVIPQSRSFRLGAGRRRKWLGAWRISLKQIKVSAHRFTS